MDTDSDPTFEISIVEKGSQAFFKVKTVRDFHDFLSIAVPYVLLP
jgi:hypothetical protein